jgi:ribonuclease HI
MKGQVIADFIVDRSIKVKDEVLTVEEGCWVLFFDGSVCNQGQCIGYIVRSPHGVEQEFSIRLKFACTNNQAKYEALLSGLELLSDVGARQVDIFGDSQLVVQQISGESQCLDGTLNEYREKCLYILTRMEYFNINHISQEDNKRANALAQQASGYEVQRGKYGVKHKLITCSVLAIQENGEGPTGSDLIVGEDWRKTLIEYISNPDCNHDQKTRRRTLKYCIIDGCLYRQIVDGILLKCLNKEEAKVAMGEVHEGMCGAHQSGQKMHWMLRRSGVYWPKMVKDCLEYYRGCEA